MNSTLVLLPSLEFRENGEPDYTFSVNLTAFADNRQIVAELFKHGLVIKPGFEDMVASHLQDQMRDHYSRSLKHYYSHKLGWQNSQLIKEPVFLINEVRFNNNKSILHYSTNDYNYSKGKLADYDCFLMKEIFPYKNIGFGFSLGISSMISSYLAKDLPLSTLVVDVCGESSKGKTTLLELIASIYCNPDSKNENSFVRNFDATANSLLAGCEGFYGVPIIIDDTSTSAGFINYKSLVYQLSDGKQKGRCNSNGSCQSKRESWNSIVLVSSEEEIVNLENAQAGASVRLLNLNDIQWTNDASHSNRIKAFIRKNYGLVYKSFVDLILSIDKKQLITDYRSSVDYILSKMVDKDAFSERIAESFACIYLASILVKKKYNLDESYSDDVVDLLVKADNEAFEKRDDIMNTCNKLKDFIFSKFKHFYWCNDFVDGNQSIDAYDVKTIGDIYGCIRYQSDFIDVKITKSAFKQFIAEYCVKAPTKFKKNAVSQGILQQVEKDRYTKKCTIDKLSVECYHFKFKYDDGIMGVKFPIDSVYQQMEYERKVKEKKAEEKRAKAQRAKEKKVKAKIVEDVEKTPVCTTEYEENIDEIFEGDNNEKSNN